MVQHIISGLHYRATINPRPFDLFIFSSFLHLLSSFPLQTPSRTPHVFPHTIENPPALRPVPGTCLMSIRCLPSRANSSSHQQYSPCLFRQEHHFLSISTRRPPSNPCVHSCPHRLHPLPPHALTSPTLEVIPERRNVNVEFPTLLFDWLNRLALCVPYVLETDSNPAESQTHLTIQGSGGG